MSHFSFNNKNAQDEFIQLVPKDNITFELDDDTSLIVKSFESPLFRVKGLSKECVSALVGSVPCNPEIIPKPLQDRNIFKKAIMKDKEVAATFESLRLVPPKDNPVEETLRDGSLEVCRFTVVTPNQNKGGVVLENPLTGAKAYISKKELANLLPLTFGCKPKDIYQRTFQALLISNGFLLTEDSEFLNKDEYIMWDTPDLYFHSRSRLGRTDQEFGGVFPYVNTEVNSRPAKSEKWINSSIRVDLPAEKSFHKSHSLSDVMKWRHSTREFTDSELTLESLGTLLARAARVKHYSPAKPGGGLPYDITYRPYPTGGAAYELEIYISCFRVEGITPGIYWYDPFEHQLVLVKKGDDYIKKILNSARRSAGSSVNPQAVLTFTSRLGRLNWKYKSIAYATTLKHVGVLYQTLYLVATDMGLGACGLGSGNSDDFCELTGLDYLEETSVGDFMIGIPQKFTADE